MLAPQQALQNSSRKGGLLQESFATQISFKSRWLEYISQMLRHLQAMSQEGRAALLFRCFSHLPKPYFVAAD